MGFLGLWNWESQTIKNGHNIEVRKELRLEIKFGKIFALQLDLKALPSLCRSLSLGYQLIRARAQVGTFILLKNPLAFHNDTWKSFVTSVHEEL